MTRDPLNLDQIQRWMQAVITHPDGVAAGLDSSVARAEIDVSASQLEQVVSRSQRRTSVERLEVYANAYYARLLECLRDEFPALFHAVGEEVFDGLAFGYLQSYPSQSYTLSELSGRFPRFLEETRPQSDDDDGPSWPDFMIDLARLERTYSEVFDGPGTEREFTLSAEQIHSVPPQQWPDARLVCAPCLRLLSLQFPVHEFATAVREKEDPAIPEPAPTWLAISRINYRVRRWSLSQTQFDLLDRLLRGIPVGRAIESATQKAIERGESVDQLEQSLRDWFEEWSAAGFFQSVEP